MTMLRKAGRRRAAAVVETAIVLPLLFMILYGVWEVGRLVHVTQIVGNCAREGARLCSTGIYTSSGADPSKTANQVQLAVANYMQNSGLAIAGNGILITVTNETRAAVSCQCEVTPTSGPTQTPVVVTATTVATQTPVVVTATSLPATIAPTSVPTVMPTPAPTVIPTAIPPMATPVGSTPIPQPPTKVPVATVAP